MDQQTNPSSTQPVAEKRPWAAPKLTALNIDETKAGGYSIADGSAALRYSS
jgi:hypothetical protein